jgi:ribosome-binding factor A
MSRGRWGDPLAKNPGRRQARVSDLLRREIGELVQRKYADSTQPLITVTEVRVSGDLRQARIFVTVLADAERQHIALKNLQNARQELRKLLAERIELKYVPSLQFLIDDSAERAQRIEELLVKSSGSEQGD